MSTYYDFSQLLSYNGTYNVIADSRGSGKTYGWTKLALNGWFKNRDEFFYLRRYKEEIQKSAPLFFNAIAHEFPYADFKTEGMFARVASAETRGTKKRQWDTIGYFGALSTSHQLKSVPFPNVRRIGYDEFIIERGNTVYITSEVAKLNNFFSTVNRRRTDCKLFMMANAVSMSNPYFAQWGIRPDLGVEFQKLWKNPVTGKHFMIAHFPEGEGYQAEARATDFGMFVTESDPEYADYAIGNKFADAHTELISSKTSDAKYRFSLETPDGTFSIWYDRDIQRFFAQGKRPKVEKLFTLMPHKVASGKPLMVFQDRPLSTLRTAFRHARLLFDEPATRNSFINIFNTK